jgi:hypothetical protein
LMPNLRLILPLVQQTNDAVFEHQRGWQLEDKLPWEEWETHHKVYLTVPKFRAEGYDRHEYLLGGPGEWPELIAELIVEKRS